MRAIVAVRPLVSAFHSAMAGGMEAVVWTDVVQVLVLMLGGLFVLGRLLFAPEAGAPFAVVAAVMDEDFPRCPPLVAHRRH